MQKKLSIDEIMEYFEEANFRINLYMGRRNGKHKLSKINIAMNQIPELLKKLKTYEDAEEAGLLLRLPIAEGTQVFCIGSCGELCNDYETDCETCGEHQVVFCINFDRNMIEQLGKTVFTTEEEAEAALKKM